MIRSKWLKLQDKTPVIADIPPRLFLSNNEKTGLSLNTSMLLTCSPTKACKEYCYGHEGRIMMNNARKRQVENYLRFEYLETAEEKEVEREATGIAWEILAKQNFLRVFGVGDLQKGSVRFINQLVKNTPELAVWVATRKPDLAKELVTAPNLFVMFGVDNTTPVPILIKILNLVTNKQNFYPSWVQTSPTDTAPAWVSVVFAEHHIGLGRAKWSATPDSRTCPATALNGRDHEGACANCRRCFTS